MVGFPAKARYISLLQVFQFATGTHPASYSRGTKSVSPGAKWLKRGPDHSLPSRAEVINASKYVLYIQFPV
jgi:hypothetical protein